ncbi:hypothetical protein CHUAL_000676 [Chamberlinius hualienensis]
MEDNGELNEIHEVDEDYYAFLNVSKQATNDEINNAYRRLSRLYHPDKHSDPNEKKLAEILFAKTKKAYEVLSDPHSRAIYDSLGTKGLETEGWEIVQRTKTPQEIREEYERLARERDERKLQQRTNPKGSVVVNINASDLFDAYVDDDEEQLISQLPQLEVSGMTINQSIEAPLTTQDTLTLGGQLQSHNGNGSGTVNCSWRRILSAKSWTEVDIGAGSGPIASVRYFRSLSKRTFANMAGICHITPHGIRPGIQTVIGRQLDKHTMGYLTWKAGIQSCMNTTVVWDTTTNHLAFSLQLGIPNTFAMLSYTRKFEDEFKLRSSIKVGTFGLLFEYGCEKKVSQHSIVGASMGIGVPVGVTLKIKVNRGNQNYSFPVLLSSELLPSPIFYGTVIPIATYYVVKVFIVSPYLKRQKLRDAEKQKEANASKVAEKKREAESAVNLMQKTYERIVETEEKKNGLVIIKAIYGNLQKSESDSGSSTGQEVIDVTVQLQCLVKDSKLIIYESSKCQLPGFYDPCVGEEKSLLIKYKFHNLQHEVTITDDQMIRLPKQSHRIDQ